MLVEFFGVRGSCPCPSPQHGRYGGNTACVSLTVADQPPIIFDLGTGLRSFGGTQPTDGSFRGTALVTHIHWDHVQGLPFFPPADRTGAQLDIYGPAHPEGTLAECFDGFMRPPYFPIRFRDLRGEYRFHDVGETGLKVGEAEVLVREVPHTGPTLGYRVTWDGATVTYISDHQAPIGLDSVPDAVLKKPGRLTPEEFDEIKLHSAIGAQLLKDVVHEHPGNTFLPMGVDIAHGHHEKWDGSGYPQGLAGTNIPLSGRIVAVADVYDALSHQRCYKPAMTHEESAAIIKDGAGKHFDPELVEIFSESAAEFQRILHDLDHPPEAAAPASA